MRSKILAASSGLLLCMASASASAVDMADEYSRQIKSAEAVGTLGPDMFGDQTNFYTGGTEFTVTDVSLPGNHGLPMRIGRRFQVGEQLLNPGTRPFADWDLDIPHLQGVFSNSKGWQSLDSNPNKRCSVGQYTAVPPVASNQGINFTGDEYWSGNTFYLPGSGSQEMLTTATSVNPNKPNDGKTHYWVTNNQWYFSCLPNVANPNPSAGYVQGEAFLALGPDGTRIWFNWAASRPTLPVTKPSAAPSLRTTTRNEPGTAAKGGVITPNVAQTPFLARKEVRMLPTRVEDRFGNAIIYTYDPANPWRLTSITSTTDNRQLALTYNAAGYISTVSDGTRTWTYGYGTGSLATVTLPDASQWQYGFGGLSQAAPMATEEPITCEGLGTLQSYPYTGTATHPSGAQATFNFDGVRHGRSQVTRQCVYSTYPTAGYSRYPSQFDVVALTSKSVSGPGLTTAAWTYTYGAANDSYTDQCTNGCPTTKTVEVNGPAGEYTRYTFGNRFFENEGKLLTVERGSGPGAILSTEQTGYLLSPSNQLYPAQVGLSPYLKGDRSGERLTPTISRSTTQQGATFNWAVNSSSGVYSFDAFAHPTAITRSSTGNAGGNSSRSETTVYAHNLDKWVLGQVTSVTCTAPAACAGKVISQTEYDPTTWLPWKTYSFGVLQQTLTYNADGTLATIKDGRNNITTASNWHRGIPQLISYPNSTSESANVNAIGRVLSTTNEASSVHGYSYDALGRLSGITYPTGDTPAWNGTTRSFVKVATAEYGIAAGHWKQTVQTGNGRTTTFYDAQWRPLLVLTEDVGNATSKSFVVTRYDAAGRAVFTSYPVASLTSVNDTLTGMRTFYDALNRVIRTEQDDQGSPVLVSTTEFLTGFQTRSTNPRGIQSTATYQVFDAPSTDAPITLVAAVGQTVQQTTTIARDVFGKPTSVTRSGTYGGNAVSATRSYVYDSSERLCKTVEPETGASLIDYDAAGNVAWTTQGSTLTSLTCDRASVPVNEKTTRTYDTLNRVTQVTTPDGVANVVTTYTPDGLVASLVANNLGTNNAPVTTTYTYNNRRLLQQETSLQLDAQSNPITATVVYGYSANGHLASHQYPTNLVVSYAPDALGRTTAVTGSDGVTYASGLGYYPNGSIAQFSYGNGVVHTLTQNPRRLPGRSQDAKLGGALVLDDTYAYDPNGNVLSITDAAQAGKTTRTMGYDALDRLTMANAMHSSMWGAATYAYDPLDNLRIADQGTRQYRYSYDAITNRLNTISNPAGQSQITLDYDVRGNVTGKTTSAGTQVLAFDRGNRLSYVAGQEYYAYDGQGRRVQSWTSPAGGSNLYVYSQGGQLLYTNDARRSRKTDSIYLGNTLLAQRHVANGTNVVTVSYQHTDALGSVVAETDATGTVTRRNAYAPYGEEYTTGAKVIDGQGYTGHVMDLATGFTYMQARYFDPVCACFLSADPMASDVNTAWNFNRYNYAANNPYRFTDPDGRAAVVEQSVDTGLASTFTRYTLSVGSFNVLREGRRTNAQDTNTVKNLLAKIVSDGRLNFEKKVGGPTIELNIIGSPIRSSIVTVINLNTNSAKINFSPIHSLMIGSLRQRPRILLFHELMHVYDGFHNRMMPGSGDSSRDNTFVIPAEREYARSLGLTWRNSHDEGELVRYGEDD